MLHSVNGSKRRNELLWSNFSTQLLKKVHGSSQQRKFAVTHRVLAHAERTVQAIVENSSSRNRETNSASAFLPALAW